MTDDDHFMLAACFGIVLGWTFGNMFIAMQTLIDSVKTKLKKRKAKLTK